ncbi:MAG: protease inhibitor I42 family protein [Candidatus Sumerlaeota bacterium]|nr:protease inhibitor I42 family protein [Candidatus Sumerlaeota bacterium]
MIKPAILFVAFSVSALMLDGAAARAELCEKCKGMMFIANIGKCAECGAATSSGAKKLCPACSKKLGECEACRMKLVKSGPAPAPTPGATSQTSALKPAQELDLSASGQTVTLEVGQQLRVRLKGNPTTGYSWSDPKIEGAAVESAGKPEYVTDNAKRPDAQRLVGAGGEFVFTFSAKKEGTSKITLEYRRPWEKETPPIKTFTCTVVVKKAS